MLPRILHNSLIYAVGSALNSLALIILMPYLVNALSSRDFGAWAIYEIVILLLTMIILPGLDVGLMREYWYLETEDARRRLAGTVLLAVTGAGLFVTFSIAIVSAIPLVRETVLTDLRLEIDTHLVMLVVMISSAESVFNVFLTVFRIRERALTFVTLSAGRMLFLVVGGVLGVRFFGGVTGALIGRMTAGFIWLVVAGIVASELYSLRFEGKALWRCACYGFPLLPANMASYVLLASDRYILKMVYSLEIVAIYTFAYKLSSVLDTLVTRPFAIEWAPRRFKIATQPEPEARYGQALILYLFVSCGSALAILSATPWLYAIVAPAKYQDGQEVVPLLLLAYVIYGLSYPLNVGIMLRGKTGYLSLIGIASAAACVALNVVLIPRFGMLGAAWATVLSYVVWTGGITAFSQGLYRISYSAFPLALVCFGTAAGYLVLARFPGVFGSADSMMSFVARLGWVGVVIAALGYGLRDVLRGRTSANGRAPQTASVST